LQIDLGLEKRASRGAERLVSIGVQRWFVAEDERRAPFASVLVDARPQVAQSDTELRVGIRG
jgi:hypothetical protein